MLIRKHNFSSDSRLFFLNKAAGCCNGFVGATGDRGATAGIGVLLVNFFGRTVIGAGNMGKFPR